MKEISTEIEIDASAELVWQVLTDFSTFPDWNPFVKSLEGEVREGERIKVRLKGMTFRPTVLKFEPNSEFRWLGHLVIPGIFDGEHYFRVEQSEADPVRFVQGERFTGVLVPLMSLVGLFKSTLEGFDEMNRALKERAEQ